MTRASTLFLLLLASGCNQKSAFVFDDGRPCATQSRTPWVNGDVHPADLVEQFNRHPPFAVEFHSSDSDIPAEAMVPDTVTLTLATDWTAEQVVYGPPDKVSCPEAGERVEVHGMLSIASEQGLAYQVPMLLSSPTSDIQDAALLLWSEDVDDGRSALNPTLLPVLPPAFAGIAAQYPDDGGPRVQLGLTIATTNGLAGRLGDRLFLSLSTYNDGATRSSGFMGASVRW